ncbi:MAG: hypothetical protein Q4C50_02550 [Eubacteriales bacterium]|nr:hypothetical protein [Eubacteriales bacterium]
MKRARKTGAAAVLLICLTLLLTATAEAGFRKVKVNSRSYYRYYTSKTNYIKGKKGASGTKAYLRWRFLNLRKNGKTATYCFDENGIMQTGWKRLAVLKTDSRTKKKTQRIEWYYFDSSGKMYKNRTKNGHYLQSNGAMLTNGVANGVYYGADGSAVPGYHQKATGGSFVKNGKKGTKFRKYDGSYASKEWLCIKKNGKYGWYYFYTNGYLAKNKWLGTRHVDKNGMWDKTKAS